MLSVNENEPIGLSAKFKIVSNYGKDTFPLGGIFETSQVKLISFQKLCFTK